MFQSNERVGNIEALEQKIAQIEGRSLKSNKSGYWQKLSSYCESMSADQLNFINNNANVQKKRLAVIEAFNLYLFEKYKEEFALIENIKPLCDEYIEAVTECSKEYSDKAIHAVEENENLKAKIAELERELNDKNNSKGTGQSRRVRAE